MDNTKCIFTYITGGYDNLIEPKTITPGWDYLCFTDSPNINTELNSVWEICPINEEHMQIKCPKRRGNAVVMQYYKYIPEKYDICIAVDGNIIIEENLDDFLSVFNFDTVKYDFMIASHPTRDCIYDEAKAIMDLQKDSSIKVSKHIGVLRQNKYPLKNGLYQTNIMVLNNKSENMKIHFDGWYTEYMRLPSKRDQMTLNYAIWKTTRETGVQLNVLECPMLKSNKINQKKFKTAFNEFFENMPHMKGSGGLPKRVDTTYVHKPKQQAKPHSVKKFIERRKRG
jgi:O-antigen biosynthesis protein